MGRLTRAKDLLNLRFNRLLVTGFVGIKNGHAQWECLCDCGNNVIVWASNLQGRTGSCGCRVRDINKGNAYGTTHGKFNSSTYVSWKSMKRRCRSNSNEHRPYYKDRGIYYDPTWEDFERFFSDMGPRPQGKSLDRINNDLGYSKDNCRWATPMEQAHNRRKATKRAA